MGGIRFVLEVAALAGAVVAVPPTAGRGLIFTLHHVRPLTNARGRFSPNAHLSVVPEFLEQAILAAREAGLTPVHLDDIPALLADPGDTRRFVAFTLDDGYRDNAEHAAPVFRRHRIPFTIFATAGFVERTRTIWWETTEAMLAAADAVTFDFGNGPEEVPLSTPAQKQRAFDRIAAFLVNGNEDEAIDRIDEAARRAGIDPVALVRDLVMDEGELQALAADPLARIGAHTLTHPILSNIDDARLARELAASAEAVERFVGRRPRTLAYPYGSRRAVCDRAIAAAGKAGFDVAVLTQPGMLGARSLAAPTAMPRVSLNGLFQKKRYVRALISGLPFAFA
jgi:peptidoglycan/xylan/chitin deacetylase (PgdA/CDA1 family)